ncbi:hypothetical protein RvY_14798 [Ramazzottius varieornatus]|uniref:Uncharacterized protein n=1 Tax=Ramazzottius varieornatus TaxID=947166 RepID=A0A1D1VSN7_RAMVA|nr:hypothetical protein RvY_14798 [Ramazzottius varieornatus]
MPTHDLDFESYDSTFQIIVYCATGYAMTGISKKQNPYKREWQVEWIQCCRVGYGKPYNVPPPVVYSDSGAAAYFAPVGSTPNSINPSYSVQYRSAALDDENLNIVGDGVKNRSSVLKFWRKPEKEEKIMLNRPELFAAMDPKLRSRSSKLQKPRVLRTHVGN